MWDWVCFDHDTQKEWICGTGFCDQHNDVQIDDCRGDETPCEGTDLSCHGENYRSVGPPREDDDCISPTSLDYPRNRLESLHPSAIGGLQLVQDEPCEPTPICPPDDAQAHGLPDGNVITSPYDTLRVYRHDGTVESVPPGYVLDPETDREVRIHHGIDYSSRSPAWEGAVMLPFTGGVIGRVDVVENSQWNTITITLGNGNTIQFLHASRVDVVDGQIVGPDTVLGVTGNTGLGPNGAIHLHVQARDAAGNWINPHDVLGNNADPSCP